MNELILVYVIISNIVEKYIILERIYKMKNMQFAIVPIIFFWPFGRTGHSLCFINEKIVL